MTASTSRWPVRSGSNRSRSGPTCTRPTCAKASRPSARSARRALAAAETGGSGVNGIFVVGIGMTPFGRHSDRSIKDLTKEAVAAALSDAGCEYTQLGLAVFSNVAQGHMEGQHA